jgi:hypothetical protein
VHNLNSFRDKRLGRRAPPPRDDCADFADAAWPHPCASARARYGDGGWDIGPMSREELRRPPPLPIDRRFNISFADFQREYVDESKPVILTGLMNDWKGWDLLTREQLVAHHGERQLKLLKSSVSAIYNRILDGWYELNKFHAPPDFVSVKDYIDQHFSSSEVKDPLYRFDGEPEILNGTYEHPDVFGPFGKRFLWSKDFREQRALLTFGPANSGAGFHSHTAAFNALFYGSKRWYLSPPNSRLSARHPGPRGSTMPMREFVDDHYDGAFFNAVDFMQQPGEIVFVPAQWRHGVINLQSTMGVAVELGDDTYFKVLPSLEERRKARDGPGANL